MCLSYILIGSANTAARSFARMAPASGKKSRNWLFTCNRYNDDDESRIKELAGDLGVKYLVYGREKAPSTGHAHLQGFVIFRHARKFSGVKTFFQGLTHADLRVGDDKAVAMMDYCKKGGDFVEFGDPPKTAQASGRAGGQKKQESWKVIVQKAKDGKFGWIEKHHPKIFTAHYRTFKQLHKDYGAMPKDEEEVTGVWIYGPAGAGKSHYAREKYGNFYDKPCNKWFDNYQGEPHVLLDDFDDKHAILAHFLKRWADRYAFSAETKGGQINLRPKKVIVTSQYRIDEIWSDSYTRDALNRRFYKIKIHIDSQGNRVIQEQGF